MPRTDWKDRNYRYRLIHKLIDQQLTDIPNPTIKAILDVKHYNESPSSGMVSGILNYVNQHIQVVRFVYEVNNSNKESAAVLGEGHPLAEGFQFISSKEKQLSPIEYYKRICVYRQVKSLDKVFEQLANWKKAPTGIFPELEYFRWHMDQGSKYGMTDLDIIVTPNRFFVDGCVTVEWDYTTNQPVALIWVKEGNFTHFDNDVIINLGTCLNLDTYIIRMVDGKFYFRKKQIDKSFLDEIRNPNRNFDK